MHPMSFSNDVYALQERCKNEGMPPAQERALNMAVEDMIEVSTNH